ncbi:unnamed protein product [Parascedosporium putredinis]|uniref:Mitochondrial intermembrane space import and assembly protein 40 n=1 Tax=Parascedosporium putredinis TaxID=1442378 RepID=A0A9P1GZJ5_9PEZI|nr:unnamed protein product [Parascedosporium putredinis]CAI7991747.1 unnamed protein product [Parascedosporium putredinis]
MRAFSHVVISKPQAKHENLTPGFPNRQASEFSHDISATTCDLPNTRNLPFLSTHDVSRSSSPDTAGYSQRRDEKNGSPPGQEHFHRRGAQKGTWKGSAARWGAAAAALYWYNTSPLFADDPAPQTIPAPTSLAEEELVTVDKAAAAKQAEDAKKAEEAKKAKEAAAVAAAAAAAASSASSAAPDTEEPALAEGGAAPEKTEAASGETSGQAAPAGSPAALQEEADQQGAFNPETGEINWDCPCLGGMAHGPCGEEFRAAFSCFVYSKEEPKGMDCIDKFQGMQDCFRLHPEVYGAELMDDEEGEGALDGASPQSAASNEFKAAKATPPRRSSKAPIYDDDDVTNVTPAKAVDATAVNVPGSPERKQAESKPTPKEG